MRLVNYDYNIDIPFADKNIVVLVIERPDIYLDFLTRLSRQAEGSDDFCILSENDKELELNKVLYIMSDFMHISINDRKILGRLYQDIEDEMLSNDVEKIKVATTEIERMVLSICENSEYALTYTPDIALTGLLKLFDLRFEIDDDSFCSKIVDAVKIYHRILGIKLFVMVNLRMYLSDEVADELLKTLLYENVNILCIERFEPYKLDIEKHFILDKDLCMILDEE